MLLQCLAGTLFQQQVQNDTDSQAVGGTVDGQDNPHGPGHTH